MSQGTGIARTPPAPFHYCGRSDCTGHPGEHPDVLRRRERRERERQLRGADPNPCVILGEE